MVKYIIAALAGASAAVIFALNARTPLSSEAEYSRHPQRREEKFQDDVSVLIRGLRSPDPQARSIFHRNLVEETGMFFGFKPAALPEERMAAIGRWEDWWAANYNKTKEQWLIDCLSLEDYDGKVLAVKTLARMSSGASTPAIVSLLDDPDAQLRIEAVRALGRLKAEDAVGRLATLLESDKEPRVRRAAARALGQIGSGEALLALVETASEKDMLTRIEAVSALVLRAPERALPVLHSVLADGDTHARLFAISRLVPIRRPESVPHLAKLLGSEKPVSDKAHQALHTIVGKDLGPQPGPWIEWYEEHKKQAASDPM